MAKVVTIGKDRNAQARVRQAQAAARAQMGSMVAPFGWATLQRQPIDDETRTVFTNHRCEATVRPHSEIAYHVTIAPRGGELTWAELQQVKIDIFGFEVWGWEAFPPVSCELKGERNQHLFVLQRGVELPIGLIPKEEQDRRAQHDAIAEKIGAYVDTQKVQVILPTQEGQAVQVYADVDDALACQADGALKEVSLNQLPVQDTAGVTWSPAARQRREETYVVTQAMIAEMRAQQAHAEQGQSVQAISDLIDGGEQAEQEEAQAAVELEAMRARMREER